MAIAAASVEFCKLDHILVVTQIMITQTLSGFNLNFKDVYDSVSEGAKQG